jgi:hypothetical protein
MLSALGKPFFSRAGDLTNAAAGLRVTRDGAGMLPSSADAKPERTSDPHPMRLASADLCCVLA